MALTCLEKAVEYGFADFKHIESDSDLENIREEKRYIKILADLKREQGCGVQPDMEVYPTIEDFRIGKDRVLEKALEYLNNQIR